MQESVLPALCWRGFLSRFVSFCECTRENPSGPTMRSFLNEDYPTPQISDNARSRDTISMVESVKRICYKGIFIPILNAHFRRQNKSHDRN